VPEKTYLLTPGPTPVPPQVLAVLAEQVLHHRGPDFRAIYADCLARLRRVTRTEHDVLLFTTPGTGALESAVANLVSPGDRVCVVSAGYFGERWGELARAYGADVVDVRYAWGENPSPDDLRRALADAGGASVVYVTHCETSTGVVADVQALAEIARGAEALVVVDAVSSLGAVPVETEAWGLDVVVAGSQKALMAPPGLSLAGVSPGALAAAARSSSPRYFLDWERTRAAQERLDPPVTPAVSLVRALHVALGMILDEGLDAVFERHVRLGRACREGAKAMGLELFSPDDDRSAVVTALRVPDGVDASALLLTLRERFGVQLVGGQGELRGKVFRIGHIGWFDVFDVSTALAAVELVLAEMGAEIERGVAVSRALEVFEHTPA
jgi:aspartate aminotransferase-like enzyme